MTALLYTIEKQERKFLIGIVIAAFFISAAYSIFYKIQPIVDAEAYDLIAQNLVSGQGYRLETDVPLAKDRVIIRVGPGYEFFLAVIYAIFGRHLWIVWLFQAAFHAVSAWLVFVIAKLVFKENWHSLIGIGAAAMFAFHPDLIIASSMLLTENLAIFIMLLTIYNAFSYFEKTSAAKAVLLGLLLGLLTLVRANLGAILLPFLLIFFFKKQFSHLLIFLLLFAAVLAPWTIRNYSIYHSFIPTAVVSGNNFLAGNHPNASGELDDSRYEFIKKYKSYDLITADKLMFKDTLSYIIQNPAHFAKLTIYRISTYFSFLRPTGWWSYLQGWEKLITLLASAAYSIALFTLGIAGFLLMLRRITGEKDYSLEERNRFTIFFILFLVIPLAVIFIIVETRYRYPVYPILAMFSGYVIYAIARRWKGILKLTQISFLFLMLNAAFDFARNFSRILEKIGNF